MKQMGLNEASAPALVEYLVDGEPWRCNRFDLLDAEFAVGRPYADRLALFHGVAALKPRGWMIVRRLFGLMPVVPAVGTANEDLRNWEREELREALGLTRPQLAAELDAIRGTWGQVRPKGDEDVARPEKKEASGPAGELHFEQENFLVQQGFEMRFRSQGEAAWFAQRVKDYEAILREKFAAVLARNTLMSELRIRQLDEMLNLTAADRVGGTEWQKLLKMRQDLDTNYQKQLEQLKVLCPWAGAIAGKHSFQGVISEVTEAYQAYYGQNDNRLIDGIFTRTEVEIESRRSVQTPEPRYRAGLVVYLNAAKAGLWDPNWQPSFESAQLKKIDAGWKGAYVEACQDAGDALPDLEADGEPGEYPVVK